MRGPELLQTNIPLQSLPFFAAGLAAPLSRMPEGAQWSEQKDLFVRGQYGNGMPIFNRPAPDHRSGRLSTESIRADRGVNDDPRRKRLSGCQRLAAS